MFVCYRNIITFRENYQKCVSKDSIQGFVFDCASPAFKPVCENGLTCKESSQSLCGIWLIDCPFHGTCMEGDQGSSVAEVNKCRYPSPTIRMIQSDRFPEKFNVTCEITDSCLEHSVTTSRWLLPIYSFTFYKDGHFLVNYHDPDPIKISGLDLDSEFQCMYTLDNVNSNKSRSVSRPEIVSGKTAVRNGGRVMLTCLDSGTEHVSDGSVSFEWKTPIAESLPTADDTLLKEGFTDVDAGSYTCRSVVDGVTSVWSKPLDLTIRWDDPVLTATDVDVSFGSPVTLTCSTNVPASFSFVFTRNGIVLAGERSLPQLDIMTFGLQDVGDYQCMAQRKGLTVGPSQTVTVLMKNTPLPVLIVRDGEVVREGQEVKLTCQLSETFTGRVHYSFIFQDFIDNLTLSRSVGQQSDLIISKFSPANEGMYECQYAVADLSGNFILTSTNSNNITLRMITAILQSSATAVPEGSDVKLVCNIINYRGTIEKFHWLMEDQNSALLTTSKNSVTIRNFQPKNAGKYSCQPVLSDPQFRNPALISHPLRLVFAPRYQKCPCECPAKSLSLPPVTPEVIEESTQVIQKNLSVSKAQLSSSVRRVSSAPDSRPSSVSAGYIAVALLSLVTGLVLIPDILSAMHILVQTCAGTSREKGRFIEEWKMKKANETSHPDTVI